MPSDVPLAAPPSFARPLHDRLARLGPLLSSAVDERKGEPVAWSGAIAERGAAPGVTLVVAVAKREPATAVAIRTTASPEHAMTMARSLAARSAKKIAKGGLCAATFDDLEDVPFAVCAPQYVVVPADSSGLDLAGVSLAVACTWEEMALDPDAREAAVRARSPGGISGEVLRAGDAAALARALDGMTRALRKAKEPLATNAAWALQSLIEDHTSLVRPRLEELALAPSAEEERRELVGALLDAFDAVVLERLPPVSSSAPRVVLARVRLPRTAGARVVPAYFYDASSHSRSTLGTRLPESPLDQDVVTGGFAAVDAVFTKHQRTVQMALAVEGALRLQRGFHADATVEELTASFTADGFTPVPLVLDGGHEPA
ncbi:MAG: hypothetical protein JWP97_2830 [Labilithrix sp.]|nr:hypothetical protein [Labilithrix sp.]